MADVPVIVTDAGDGTPAVGQLFKGVNFFLSQRLPTRSKFVADVEANGGRIVKLEKNADFVIADHVRRPTPAGSFSYTLIEQAVRDGILPNPADHALGQTINSPRAIGSRQPGKRTRTAFTGEDDLALWHWVEQEKARGQSVKGNEIYKQLEAVNSRHTWQAWRDHYVKKLMDRPPVGAMGDDLAPMDSGEDLPTAASQPQSASKKRRSRQPVDVDADQEDFDLLWGQARDIENMDETMYEDAWDMWAQVNTKHTAVEWRQIWESDVRPTYRKQRAKAKAKRRHASISGDEPDSPAARKARKRGKDRAAAPVDTDVQRRDEGALEAIHGNLEDPEDDLAALETWQESNKRNYSPQSRLGGSDARTSEVGRAVGDQIQAEIDDTTPGVHTQASEQVLASDADRAADLQVQKEALGVDPKQQSSAAVVVEHSVLSQKPEHTANGVHSSNPSQGREYIAESGNGSQDDLHSWYVERIEELNGVASTTKKGVNEHTLTEANLVSQQAGHTKPSTRGVDLLKDDQHQDQSDYVKFLQNVAGQPPQKEAEHDNDLPSVARTAQALRATQDARAATNIAVSYPKEVDKVMRDALDWPASSQRDGGQSQSQEDQFETQLSRPELPSPKNHARSLMPDFELSSQSITSQTNNDQFISQGLDDINDTHISLSIPDPEGDFTFTSSPERGQPGASSNNTVSQEPINTADPERSTRKSGPLRNEVFNISSDGPSSSPQSSQSKTASTMKAKGKYAVETQDILNAETQRPDFFLPLPDDEQEQGEDSELGPQTSQRSANNSQENTAVQMQAPHLSVPLPPDWDADTEAGQPESSNAPARQSKQKQKQRAVVSQTMDVERELESWLDTQQVRGFGEGSAIEAMQRSSMRPDLAELVLLAEKGGLGLPSDVPGIWSKREDSTLESGDSGALRRLEAKHGWDECEARMRFLAEWREA